MTPQDFQNTHEKIGITRAELNRRLGIGKNTGTAYALGRTKIPRSIALASAALVAGLTPVGEEPDATE